MYPVEYYSPVSGGALATITFELSKWLIRAGHTVSVLSPTNGDAPYDVGKVFQLPGCRREDLSRLQRLYCKLEEKRHRWDIPYYRVFRRAMMRALRGLPTAPDAVVLFNDLAGPRFVKQALPQARVFVDLQNENHTHQQDFAAADECVERYIACSNYIRRWTIHEHNLDPDRVAVLLSGIDTERFIPRQDFLDNPSRVKVATLGRIDPNKGADIAVDAVAALQEEGISADLAVAGGTWFYGHNPKNAYLKELIKKTQAARGTYVGPVSRGDVPGFLRGQDVGFVLSRSNEPFGLVVLEMMAAGCAVIASDRGGIPEACGNAARLVDPEDGNAVLKHLRELVANNQSLRDAKQKSVARAQACAWSTRAEQFLAIVGQGRHQQAVDVTNCQDNP